MNFEIILKDGTSIFPSFAPEHKDSVIAFYREQFELGNITGWAIR